MLNKSQSRIPTPELKKRVFQPQMLNYDVNRDVIDRIQSGYSTLTALPSFINKFLKLEPSEHLTLFINHPEHFRFLSYANGTVAIIGPNPGYFKETHEERLEKGVGIIVWMVNEELLKGTAFEDKEMRDVTSAKLKNTLEELKQKPEYFTNLPDRSRTSSGKKINELESKYYGSILDLSKDDVPMLEKLNEDCKNHMQSINGDSKPKVYFHFPYHHNTVGLHVHVRSGHANPNLEKNIMYPVEEVINNFKNDRNIQDLILERGEIQTATVDLLSLFQDANANPKVTTNPYYVDPETLTKSGSQPTLVQSLER